MREVSAEDVRITAIVALVMSLVSVPYLDWWGLLVGPALVATFAWAYYSMAFVSWLGEVISRFIGRA
ncbi:hypothetical protein SNN83_001505 [Cronobacter malonaticus]|nr:hypothetical protein [Cronobacter malonaticus]